MRDSTKPKTRNPTSKTWLKWGVRVGGTLLLLIFLFRLNLDFAKILTDLQQAHLGWVALSVGLVFPFIALKAWRWQIILRDLGIALPFEAAYRLYAVGLAAGSFTPGQAGDAIKAFYMKERGYPLSMGLVSIVLDRLFDLAVLILLATCGLFLLGADFAGDWPVLALLLSGTLAGLVALSLSSVRNWLINRALQIFKPKPTQIVGGSSAPDTDSLRAGVATRASATDNFIEGKVIAGKLTHIVPVFGVTLLASMLALFRIWLLALALDLPLNLLQVVAVSSLATVVSLVPISVGGIGARDVVLVGILDKLGYVKEKAISLSTLILLLNLVNLVVGYLIWATRSREERIGKREEFK